MVSLLEIQPFQVTWPCQAKINQNTALWMIYNNKSPNDQVMGYQKTVQNQVRCYRFCTVCLQNVLLEFEWHSKLLPNNPLIRNGFIQLKRAGNCFRQKWDKMNRSIPKDYQIYLSPHMRFQQCVMCNPQILKTACACTLSDQRLCLSPDYSMTVRLLTKQHLEFPVSLWSWKILSK